MDGDTKWEEAWRAFDADIQSAHDAQMFVSNTKTPREVFNSIAEEFNVTSSEVDKQVEGTNEYEKAWRRLGAWIYRQDPSFEETVNRYQEIIRELELDDETWSELA